MASVKLIKALPKVLENLTREDLVKFQTHLTEGVLDGSPTIPKSSLPVGNVQETVNQMVKVYGAVDAAEISEIILRRMKQTFLAQSLTGIKESFSPEVVFGRYLYDGLKNQMIITIQGQVKQHSDQFTVDLWRGKDMAFHFNPVFNENENHVIVRNSRIGGVWGVEERQLSSFPFTPGQDFEMKILCNSTEFRVEVDNKHVLNYTHRIKELQQIKKLTIEHDVVIKSVQTDPLSLWMKDSLYILEDIITENMSIIVRGHVKPNAKKFTIDVMKGSDILFHFKPYFTDNGQNWIMRNTFIANTWGGEDVNTPNFPFARGKPFLVRILCTDKEFKVYVDGSHLLDFSYRSPDTNKINSVSFLQDVITFNVSVEP